MVIVHIEDFFHPEAGYQVNILAKYMALKGHDVTIITSALEKLPEYLVGFFGKDRIKEKDLSYTQNTGVKIVRLPILKYISGRTIWGKSLDNYLTHIHPDLIFVHGNDTATGIKFMFKLGKTPYAIITDSHMLAMASRNRFSKLFHLFYRLFVTPRIVKYKLPVIRTQDDEYTERYLGIPLKQCPYISLGADLLLFHPDKDNKLNNRKKHKISQDDFVIIYAGKLDASKGGQFLAETFLDPFIVSENIVLIVVGTAVGDYGKNVEQLFKKSPYRILRFPTQAYVNLAPFYQMADIAVFPKQCSLSFYDVQACALPVIAEANSINQLRLSHDNGLTFKIGSIESFREKIIEIIEMSSNQFQKLSSNSLEYIQKYYNYDSVCDKYLEIIKKEYSRQKGDAKNGVH